MDYKKKQIPNIYSCLQCISNNNNSNFSYCRPVEFFVAFELRFYVKFYGKFQSIEWEMVSFAQKCSLFFHLLVSVPLFNKPHSFSGGVFWKKMNLEYNQKSKLFFSQLGDCASVTNHLQHWILIFCFCKYCLLNE